VKEAELLRAVLDWLQAERIFSLRMNTGAVKADGRFFRFGTPGCADVLAFPKTTCVVSTGGGRHPSFEYTTPVWIETKTAKGQQSMLQKSFEEKVLSEGHQYVLARSLNDVIRAFGRSK
jgi:hypothetical protein